MALVFYVLMSLFVVVAGPSSDLTGIWSLSFKADWTRIPQLTCEFVQKGQELTGACKAEGDPDGRAAQLTNGRIDAQQVQFGWKIDTPDGETWTYMLNGKVDDKAETMNGAFKISGQGGGGEGSFAAKKR